MTDLLSLIWNYGVPFATILTVVVFVHEFGHYWVARRCGVRVETFSIGFGPELFHRMDKHGTRWRVALFPIGGYVKFFGDADPASMPDAKAGASMSADDRAQSFFAKPLGQKSAIVAAGPVINYIFAFVVLVGLFMAYGRPFTPPMVGGLVEGGAAQQAGLLKGDRILSVDGYAIERFEDIQRQILLANGQPVRLRYAREGNETEITVTPIRSAAPAALAEPGKTDQKTPDEQAAAARPRLGVISPTLEFRKLGGMESISAAGQEVVELTWTTLRTLGQAISGARDAKEVLGGPLRIAQMSGETARMGLANVLWFVALLSLNLGLLNLFPIPLLDGGHLLFYACEKLRGRPLGERVQEAAARIGLGTVLALMLFATWNDIVQLRVFSFLKGLFS